MLQSPSCQGLVPPGLVSSVVLSPVCVLGSGLHGKSCHLASSELFCLATAVPAEEKVGLVEARVEHSRMIW